MLVCTLIQSDVLEKVSFYCNRRRRLSFTLWIHNLSVIIFLNYKFASHAYRSHINKCFHPSSENTSPAMENKTWNGNNYCTITSLRKRIQKYKSLLYRKHHHYYSCYFHGRCTKRIKNVIASWNNQNLTCHILRRTCVYVLKAWIMFTALFKHVYSLI